MFGVYDNNKPASEEGVPSLKYKGWKTHRFETFEEAKAYVNEWLGMYKAPIKVNVPYDYSGYGDFIVIKEEE